MTSCFVCATLNLVRKKVNRNGTQGLVRLLGDVVDMCVPRHPRMKEGSVAFQIGKDVLK